MTFFVEKKLALGSIRFGVGRRRAIETIDQDAELSTGPGGEFIRRRREGFFFGGHDRYTEPTMPETPSIRSTSFWNTLSAHIGRVILVVLGVVVLLLGIAVMTTKGAQGLVEVIAGLILTGIPVGMTAQERKRVIDEEERVRAERAEAEQRRREMLAGYTAALDRVQQDHSESSLQRLVDEHPDAPYNVWSSAARRTVLLIGFAELAKVGVNRSNEVARLMDAVSRSAGLTPEHQLRVKVDLYDSIVWHLLADDRLGRAQSRELDALRSGLGISDNDIPEETRRALDQFERLRAVTTANLPRTQCSMQLGFNEYCIFQTKLAEGALHVTNRRLILEGKKKHDYPLPSLSELTLYYDDDLITTRSSASKTPLQFHTPESIYTTAMIDLAASIDERPKGFA